jgi:competence protein ComEC
MHPVRAMTTPMAVRPATRSHDPVPWVGAAACAGALVLVAPIVATVTAVVVGGLALRRRVGIVVLAGLVFVAGALRATLRVRDHEARRAAIVAAGGWPASCILTGTIVRSPVMVGDGLRVVIDATEVRCRDGPPIAARTALHVPLDAAQAAAPMTAPSRGDLVSATASLAPPYRFWNDGTGDPRPASALRGVLLSGGAQDLVLLREGRGLASWIDRARGRVRHRILATFPRETAPMARALVLGEDDLAAEDQRAFRESGLAHLLAVSGMHLVLVVLGLVRAARAVLVRVPALAARVDAARVASAIGLPAAWLYAELAGGSGSAVRAAWMCTAFLSARVLARRSSAWRGLGLSMIAMALIDPLVVFDFSFLLSVLATAGILSLGGPLEEAVRTRLPVCVPSFVITPVATTAAATIACAPVLAMMSSELPAGGLLANVIAVPLGEAAALPLCLLHGLLSAWPSAESGCALAASGALGLVRLVARAFAWGAVPVPPPTPGQLGVLAAIAAGVACARRPRTFAWLGSAAVIGLEILARVHGAPRGQLRITFLDVGQGDSALVDFPDGSVMLVDGGGLVGSPVDVGERAVTPLLAARRRSMLDVVVISHPHPDHHLGLSATLARVGARELWDTGQGESEGLAGPYADLLSAARARGIRVRRPAELCGAHAFGRAIVEVLAPCPDVSPDHGPNDNSFVIRIRFGERAFLLVGDAERHEERELLNGSARERLRADVLKVGHHGSRTSSSPDFVSAVSPAVAVISCGVRNRFGHPDARTLDTLAGAGALVLRTDRDGSVVVTTDGRSLDVRTVAKVVAEP